MARLFRHSVEDAVVCEACLAAHEVAATAELLPRFFPGTYDRLTCARCGAGGTTSTAEEAAAE